MSLRRANSRLPDENYPSEPTFRTGAHAPPGALHGPAVTFGAYAATPPPLSTPKSLASIPSTYNSVSKSYASALRRVTLDPPSPRRVQEEDVGVTLRDAISKDGKVFENVDAPQAEEITGDGVSVHLFTHHMPVPPDPDKDASNAHMLIYLGKTTGDDGLNMADDQIAIAINATRKLAFQKINDLLFTSHAGLRLLARTRARSPTNKKKT